MPTGVYERKLNKTTEDFINEAVNIHGNYYDYSLSEYKGSKTKLKIICKHCGNVFKQTPSNHLHSVHPQGCPNCCKNKKKTTEDFIKKSKEIWGENKYDYSLVNYKNNKTKVILRCLIHDNIFEQAPKKHYLGEGCSKCLKKSKNEEKIDIFLKQNKISFIREFKFKDCKYKKPLPFDFYLPEKNLVIEYQGVQHFVQQGRGHETLQNRQTKDQIKRDFCKKNGIIEVEINYFDNLEEQLNKLLKIIV